MEARSAAMVETTRRHRFTVEDFHRMGEAGVFGPEDDRVELLDGEILVMGPVGNRHQVCVDRLTAIFSALGKRAILRVQGPVGLDSGSEPLPDIVLLEPREDFYATRTPGPADVLLLVEVADTSLAYDRDEKLPRYAAAGIRECWLVDLTTGVLEVHTRPSPEGYGEIRRHRRGDRLSPGAFPDLEVAVDDVLP